jgi:hypothetical protein
MEDYISLIQAILGGLRQDHNAEKEKGNKSQVKVDILFIMLLWLEHA